MQIFMPYADPFKTAKCLDNRRLGKQRIEALQIIQVNIKKQVWAIPRSIKNHPVTKMWKGYESYLFFYVECMMLEWELERDFNNDACGKVFDNLALSLDFRKAYRMDHGLPKKINVDFIKSHRALLYKKDPDYYSEFKVYA